MTYKDMKKQRREVQSYEMGCDYGYLCHDGVRYGPGPFGYTRIYRKCCCSDKCREADGVGSGLISQCVHAQYNESMLFDNGSDSVRINTMYVFILPLILLSNWIL